MAQVWSRQAEVGKGPSFILTSLWAGTLLPCWILGLAASAIAWPRVPRQRGSAKLTLTPLDKTSCRGCSGDGMDAGARLLGLTSFSTRSEPP